MKSAFASALVLIAATTGLAAAPAAPIPLWPKEAPGEKGGLGEEKDTTGAKGGLVAGKSVIRLGNVSQPTLTIYRPTKDKDTGAAVIICLAAATTSSPTTSKAPRFASG